MESSLPVGLPPAPSAPSNVANDPEYLPGSSENDILHVVENGVPEQAGFVEVVRSALIVCVVPDPIGVRITDIDLVAGET